MTTVHTRRDPRYPVRPETATVEFEHHGQEVIRGTLRQISVSGLSFFVSADGFELPAAETKIHGVCITLGDCHLIGDVVVRHAKAVDSSSVEIGGLFLPATNRDVQNLMVLISGIGCAGVD